MPRLKTSTKFFHWVIGLSVTALMIAGYWISPSLTNRIELLLQDAHFHWRGPAKPGPEVVIAAIDEKSLDELGRWPWPRVMLTRLVDKLVQLDAKVIGFDVIFASPDESSGLRNLRKIREEAKADGLETPRLMSLLDRYIGESDYDAQFAAALRRSRRAVLGFFLHYTSAGLEHLQNEALQANLRSILSSRFRGFIKSSADIDLASLGFRSAYTVESNIPIISQSVRNAGHISFDADPDGSLRKLPLIVKYHDEPTNRDYFFPPLSIPILEKFLRGTFLFRVNEFGIQKVLLDAAEPVEIPTNEKGELYINFLGARGSFPYFSITDIIHDREDLAPKKSFKDKIVLVGATATALEDLRVTPFDPILPGVEIHATIIDNILRKNYLYQPDWIPAADSAYLLILGFVLTFLFSRIKPLYAPLASVAAAAAQFYVHHWIFINKGFWISNVFPLLENVLILAGL
ncbi:MAG: CHASE2 domain-containing protein, partial [Nitrospinales bacterium]